MKFDSYQQLAKRTAKPLPMETDLMHAALGACSEAGELADAIKKHLIYGRALDRENVIEEVGDLLWFCALACSTLGVPMSEAAQRNIDKLTTRYPEKYSDQLAADRLDKGA
jgi:NTP pyrophosphatase (non-canonical NTP hydrolase)